MNYGYLRGRKIRVTLFERIEARILLDCTGADLCVTKTSPSGADSFAEAVQMANSNPELDIIAFDIDGPGPHSISLPSGIQIIDDGISIDGTTQPGYQGTPLINIHGTTNASIQIVSSDVILKGLSFREFKHGLWITNDSANNRIEANEFASNGANGVFVDHSSGNTIGPNNVIGLNDANGILISGNGASNNRVEGNFVGVQKDGSSYGNQNMGVAIVDASNNTIGGIDGQVTRNYLSGNGRFGVFIDGVQSSNNGILGNHIGSVSELVGRDEVLANEIGIQILDAESNFIGNGLDSGENVISGNVHEGIHIKNSGAAGEAGANEIRFNQIGLLADGGNKSSGLLIENAGGTEIVANSIMANDKGGISITGIDATNNNVKSNQISHNEASGVTLDSSNNQIGGHIQNEGNLISLNDHHGVAIGSGAQNNRLYGNQIVSNGEGGISVSGSRNNQIGEFQNGSEVNADENLRNIISGNGTTQTIDNSGNDFSVLLTNSSTGNRVVGNYVGTNISGTDVFEHELPDGVGRGVIIDQNSSNNLVVSNIVSGHNRDGIQINDVSINGSNIVRSNFIGTNHNGKDLSNKEFALRITRASGNNIVNNFINSLSSNSGSVYLNDFDQGKITLKTRHNTFHGNTFHSAISTVIDLESGAASGNDVGDLDQGPNDLINQPAKLKILADGNDSFRYRASFDYGSLNNFPITFDFYRSNELGHTVDSYLGSYRCINDSECGLNEARILDFAWGTVPLDATAPRLADVDYVVALATDTVGNTSEFSNVAEIQQPITADSLEIESEGFTNFSGGRRAHVEPRDDSDENETKILKWSTQNIHTFGDEDFYEITVDRPLNARTAGTFIAELRHPFDGIQNDNLDLVVYEFIDGSPMLRFESKNDSNVERISFPIVSEQVGGTESVFVVKVFGASGAVNTSYDLQVQLRDDDDDADGLLEVWEAAGGIVYDRGNKTLAFQSAPTDLRDLYVEFDAMAGLEPVELTLNNDLWQYIETLPNVSPLLNTIDTKLRPQFPEVLSDTVLDLVTAAFFEAPFEGDNRILLHLERDEIVPQDLGDPSWDASQLGPKPFATWDEFTKARDDYFGTPAERAIWDQEIEEFSGRIAKKNGYRYAFFGYQLENSPDFGRASIKSNDFVVTLGLPEDRDLSPEEYGLYQAGIFMHELGHTLGLEHREDVNLDPNYESVMNYFWMVPEGRSDWRLGYSLDSSREEWDDWGRLTFGFTYSELIDQGNAETLGIPCNSGFSTPKPAPGQGQDIPLLDYIDVPNIFPPHDQAPFDCKYYGDPIPWIIDIPFIGTLAMTISIPEPSDPEDPDQVWSMMVTKQNGKSAMVSAGSDPVAFEFVLDGNSNLDSRLTVAEQDKSRFIERRYHLQLELSSFRVPANIDIMRSEIESGEHRFDLATREYETFTLNEFDMPKFLEILGDIRAGDTNLDGLYDLHDIRAISQNYGKSVDSWGDGDFVISNSNFASSACTDDGLEDIGCLLLGDKQVTIEDYHSFVVSYRHEHGVDSMSPVCDVNSCDATDLDKIGSLLQSDRFDPLYDLNFDSQVDEADRDTIFQRMGTNIGDANLDGTVDFADYRILFANFGTHDLDISERWSRGDFVEPYGVVDDEDYEVLFREWQLPENPFCLEDGICGVEEINQLTQLILSNSRDAFFDLNLDLHVNNADHAILVERLRTFPGDANLDNQFTSKDLIQVFTAGEYEDDIENNSTWQDGDWDGDGDFGTSDLIAAFIAGKYENSFVAAKMETTEVTVPNATPNAVREIVFEHLTNDLAFALCIDDDRFADKREDRVQIEASVEFMLK